jgi:hypothetical protein
MNPNNDELSARLASMVQSARRSPPVDADRIRETQLAVRRTGARPPRSLQLSPLQAVVVAIALLLTGAFATRWWPFGADTAAVSFVFVAPSAERVVVVGDFNDWNTAATPLRRSASNTWVATVNIRPGRYSYAFVVNDSIWSADPRAPVRAEDDFGRPRSVKLVSRRST